MRIHKSITQGSIKVNNWLSFYRGTTLISSTAHCILHLTRSVDTDAVWRLIARSCIDDVVGELPVHSLAVSSLRHAVQRAPVRHCSQQTETID